MLRLKQTTLALKKSCWSSLGLSLPSISLVISSIPATATMSPGRATSAGTRSRPLVSRSSVIFTVWVLPSAQNSGFFVIALLTYLIALFHLSHIVAGSVEAMALMFSGEFMPHHAIWTFYLPALVGNVLGGSALFALISYGQVAPELDNRGN